MSHELSDELRNQADDAEFRLTPETPTQLFVSTSAACVALRRAADALDELETEIPDLIRRAIFDVCNGADIDMAIIVVMQARRRTERKVDDGKDK